jgi:hypothetical protein
VRGIEMGANLLDVYDVLSVGFRGDLKGSDEFPLVFMTYEGGSGYSKRMKTLRDWIGGEYYIDHQKNERVKYPDGLGPRIEQIKNVPISGFKVDLVVSRWTTSNKVFRIQDPRGFTLEIYADNFVNMIKNDTVVNGVFQGKYVWGRYGSFNYLVSVEDPLYLDWVSRSEVKATVTPSDIQVGDFVKGADGYTDGVFLGDVYVISYTYKKSYEYSNRDWRLGFTYSVSYKKDPRPWHVLFKLTEWGKTIHTKRKWSERDIIISSGNPVDPIDGKFDLLRRHVAAGNSRIVFAFSSKELMDEVDDNEIRKEIISHLYYADENNIKFV